MIHQFSFLGQLLLQSIVLCAIIVALYDLVRTTLHIDNIVAFCGTIFFLNLIGYLEFWIAYANYGLFNIVKIVVIILLLIWFAVAIYRRGLLACLNPVGEPLLFVFLFFSAVVALGFSNGGFDSPSLVAATRFSHHLPPDNVVPLILASKLNLGHVPSPMLGSWLSSDRPPLQTGLYLALAIQTGGLGYQIVASWLQATFLFGVWANVAAMGLSTIERRFVLLACSLLPTAIINTFFTWPKLLSVANILLVFALVFCYQPNGNREQKLVGMLIGGMAAFAALSHGSSAFALIGMAIVAAFSWTWPSWRSVAYAIPTLGILYAPWMLYQSFIDPPGNRLLKWHLAGVRPIDPRSFLATLHDSYGALTWSKYVHGRLDNLSTLVGPWPRHFSELANAIFNPTTNGLRSIRTSDFFYLLPSIEIFSVAVIAAFVLCPFMTCKQRAPRGFAMFLFGASLSTCLVYAVLLFTPASAVNHQGAYAVQVMAAMAAFIVLSLRAPTLALVIIALQTIMIVVVYGVTLPHDSKYLPMQMACIGAAVGLFVYSLFPMFYRNTFVIGKS